MLGFCQRLHTTAVLTAALLALPMFTGCDRSSTNPAETSIPTDPEQWQEKLGATFQQLSTADQQLLNRYMMRVQLSDAYKSGAMPRTTIEQALVQQREYERLHPTNSMGKKESIAANPHTNIKTAPTYALTLLPVATKDSDHLNQVDLRFQFFNQGKTAIKSFKGTLRMTDAQLPQGKEFNVPLTPFVPPIEPGKSETITVESSIEDTNVMRAINSVQNVTVTISEGTLTFIDGTTIDFTDTLAK